MIYKVSYLELFYLAQVLLLNGTASTTGHRVVADPPQGKNQGTFQPQCRPGVADTRVDQSSRLHRHCQWLKRQ